MGQKKSRKADTNEDGHCAEHGTKSQFQKLSSF